MLITNPRVLLAIILLGISFAACKKDVSSDLNGDWLFPIAKGDISLSTISTLKNLEYHIRIPAFNIGQPESTPVTSPGLRLAHVGPFPVQITDWIHRIDVDSLGFSGSLGNFFPVPIGAGTKVTLRTSRDTTGTANVAGRVSIPADVPPGQQFSFAIDVLNKTLGDSVFFFLDDFNSPAYSNVVFTTSPTQLDITLKVITASYIEIYTGRHFSSLDTAQFSAGSVSSTGSSVVVSDTAASGTFNVFVDNSLPANAVSQLYFMNEARTQVLDSLFPQNLVIAGGATDAAGNPVNTANTISKVSVTRKKLDRIRQAAFVVSRFSFNTANYPGAYVSANRAPKLSIQLTGDLNLSIRF